MLGIRCMSMGECQSEGHFVYFGAQPTQRACTRDHPRDRKRTREGRSQSSQGKKQSTEESKIGQLAGENRRLLGCVDPDARLANVRGLDSVPRDFVEISLEYPLAIAHRMLGKESQMSPLNDD